MLFCDQKFTSFVALLVRIDSVVAKDGLQNDEKVTTFVKDLLDGVFDINLEEDGVEKMFRLGCWSESKTRTFLLSFKDLDHKETILSNLSKLKATVEVREYPLIYTLRREEIKRMVDEPKKVHIEIECDEVEDYQFIVVGKRMRRRVIKCALFSFIQHPFDLSP